jgi:hypothetical protein
MFVIEYVTGWPAVPEAVGVKVYVLPALTLLAGVPEMVNGWLDDGVFAGVVAPAASTCTVKGFRLDQARPDATPVTAWMAIAPEVPTLAAVGLPVNVPVIVLKCPHEGMLVIAYVTGCPAVPDAVGVNV